MYHKTEVIGYLGADPETIDFDNGRSVTNLTLYANERYTDSEGERQTITTRYACKAWNGRGKVLERYLKQGDPLHVVGRMRFETAPDDNGGPDRIYPKLVVDDFTFIGSRRNGDSNNSSTTVEGSRQPQAVQVAEADVIPF